MILLLWLLRQSCHLRCLHAKIIIMKVNEEKIEQLLSRNVESVIEKKHFREALLSGKKLRVKLGIDPTGPKVHIGRAVVLWKLREFQSLGHEIVLIIGDMTAQVGDPSDKLEKRPFLSKDQVKQNLKNYLPQIGKILDLKKIEVRYNSEWLGKLDFREISELAENFTFQQLLERRNFRDRWEKHQEISFREGMYPLMQGYDSVAVKSDVELGGTDQLFNLLAGRKLQERYGQKPQDIMTTKMIFGLDGRKMSTSWGNVINISDEPGEQFGKIMSLRDELIEEYFEATTDIARDEIKELKEELPPKNLKERLGYEVVKRYHGERAARDAQENFAKLFSRKEVPDDVPELKLKKSGMTAVDVVIASGVAKSRGEARRLIEQGGFDLGGKTHKDPQSELTLRGGEVIKVGKKRFFKVKP
jgi:tyrosyl-tRNA synthetase